MLLPRWTPMIKYNPKQVYEESFLEINKPFILFSPVGEHQMIENERGKGDESHVEGRPEQLEIHLWTSSWPLTSLPHLESFVKWVSKQGQCPRVWDSVRMKSEHRSAEHGAYRTWCLTCAVSERQGGFPRAIRPPSAEQALRPDTVILGHICSLHIVSAHPAPPRLQDQSWASLLPQGVGQERFRSARPAGGPFST